MCSFNYRKQVLYIRHIAKRNVLFNDNISVCFLVLLDLLCAFGFFYDHMDSVFVSIQSQTEKNSSIYEFMNAGERWKIDTAIPRNVKKNKAATMLNGFDITILMFKV